MVCACAVTAPSIPTIMSTGLARAVQKASDYAPGFIAANKRAVAARERLSRERRTIPAPTAPRPSTAVLQAQKINSPKDRSEANPVVYMGEKTPPQTVEPNANLEAALERLREAIGKAGAKREGSG